MQNMTWMIFLVSIICHAHAAGGVRYFDVREKSQQFNCKIHGNFFFNVIMLEGHARGNVPRTWPLAWPSNFEKKYWYSTQNNQYTSYWSRPLRWYQNMTLTNFQEQTQPMVNDMIPPSSNKQNNKQLFRNTFPWYSQRRLFYVLTLI